MKCIIPDFVQQDNRVHQEMQVESGGERFAELSENHKTEWKKPLSKSVKSQIKVQEMNMEDVNQDQNRI